MLWSPGIAVSNLWPIVFGIAATATSLSALVMSVRTNRKKTEQDYTDELEQRLDAAERTIVTQQKEIDECKQMRQELRDQNFDLMMENRELRRGGPR